MRNLLTWTAFSLALSSCASIAPPAAPALDTRSLAQQLELSGRLSVQYQGRQKPEALHGGFTWTQRPERTVVTLLSPLGQTVAAIEAGPAGATLTQAGQPLRVAADVDTLTADALGWPLPVAGMREWLQGFATDSQGQSFIASSQADQVVTANGWHIRYTGWSKDGHPHRMDLRRDTPQAGEVSIRIVIDSWQAS